MIKNTLFEIAKRSSEVPGLRQPIIRLWNTYEHLLFVHSVRQNLSAQSVTAHLDPLQLHQIDSDNIKNMSTAPFDSIRDTGQITDGPWDLNPTDIRETSRYKRFENRFIDGNDWTDIPYYERKKTKIKTREQSRYATVAELEKKLLMYDEMYEQFRSGKYQLQSDLVREEKAQTPGDGGKALFPALTNHTLPRHEIAVNIGRRGTILRNDGRHRLALALLAGLDAVPVRIVVRHTEWQSLRDTVAQTIDNALDYGIEPDNIKHYVRDVLSDSLEDVKGDVDHPDLDIIFDRRLNDERPTPDKPKQVIPYITLNQ